MQGLLEALGAGFPAAAPPPQEGLLGALAGAPPDLLSALVGAEGAAAWRAQPSWMEQMAANQRLKGERAAAGNPLTAHERIGMLLDGPMMGFVGPSGLRATHAETGRQVASSFKTGYDPPAKPLRPFEADYPAGGVADELGRLRFDREGRPIQPGAFVVGRQTLGGVDVPVGETQVATFLANGTGRFPEGAASRELGGAVGRLTVRENRGIEPPRGIDPGRLYDVQYYRGLDDAGRGRTLMHEAGHFIDEVARTIPTKGRMNGELRDVYNSLNNPIRVGDDAIPYVKGRSRTVHYTPKDGGYPLPERDGERMSEAIRAYMADPNYLKSVAPETAAAIRKAVNEHPALSQLIHFNSVGGLLGLLGALQGEDK